MSGYREQFVADDLGGEYAECVSLTDFPDRTVRDERYNTATHGLGLVASALGTLLLAAGAWRAEPWLLAACVIYGLSMVAVYGASTLSHAIQEVDLKRRWRVIDQACIYLLIAGTYTPISLTYFPSGQWRSILWLLWAVCLSGCVWKLLSRSHRIDRVAVILYVVAGWFPALTAAPLWLLMPAQEILLIVLGGLAYTVGTLFLLNDHRAWYYHVVWHLCVLLGSGFHFLAIFHLVHAA